MRKAQIKMFETIGVLVIFFFLLVAGVAFWFNVQQRGLQKQLTRMDELQSIQVVQRALFMPELDCSFVSVQKENCFDKVKLKSFSRITSTDQGLQDYFSFFGDAFIHVKEIYPNPSFEAVIYNNTVQWTTQLKTQNPVLLYDPADNSYAFGIVEVVLYG